MTADPPGPDPVVGAPLGDEPAWVGRLCDLPARFRSEGHLLLLFQQAAPVVGHPHFEELVERRLSTRPELVGQWQGYSRDKRVRSGPYLDGVEVGVYDNGKRDVWIHETRTAACADFIHREAVLLARQPGQPPVT